jgi:hypothetical protein
MLFDRTPTYELSSLAAFNIQRIQPFNLGCVILQCSNLIYGKLGFVHQAISGEKDMSWHFPEYDCLDTAEILRWFIDNTGSW